MHSRDGKKHFWVDKYVLEPKLPNNVFFCRQAGKLKIDHPPSPRVVLCPNQQRPGVFFNQMIATLANAVEFSAAGQSGGGFAGEAVSQETLDKFLTFGDGSQVLGWW